MFKQKLYPWFKHIYKKIIIYYKKKKIQNTLFIYNLNKIGCSVLLKKIILWLFCKNKKNKNCGLCYNCNLILTKNHPDFLIVNKKKNEKYIDINYINKLIDYINIKSQENNIKIIYFPKIELLNKIAILKLLNILKQKKKNIFFIIQCNKFSNLILNIKKFCFCLNLNLPKEEISINWLKKKNNFNLLEIKTALYLNNFSPLLAHKMLNSDIWKNRNKLFNLINNCLINKNIFFLEIIKFSNLKEYINWIYILLIDLIKFKQNCKYYILNKDKIKTIINLSNYITLSKLYILIKNINIIQYKLKNIKNINIKILLIKLFFKKYL
ncbi:MAG: DNA polymerase III subunit delta' C-terminal domain-containing protein [Enterobacteriaceae bacterium PSpyr]|nr:MAG: DNA polymerase III subunit delta' C-terminal domain-containing protein [Enterobacteriaceae bacterium PSpyr]